MDLIDPRVVAYAERLSAPHDPLLAQLSEETRTSLGSERMLTGPVAGRLLEFLVWAAQPRRVLEIGTFSGHATLAMAAALPADGHIDTCELDPRRAEVAQRFIDRSPYGDRISVHVGPAIETIARLEGSFDFVFVDAEKEGYIRYYDAVLPRLCERGLIVADNTLHGGGVLDGADDPIARFNQHVAEDPRSVQVLLTVRDGLTLIRRA
jgi:caffeoyl-CoA O-methyltransferase